MTQEDKIKAAYAEAVQRDIYVTNYLSFKTGYLAAIADLKAKGPILYMYQHDETARTTFRVPNERMVERRWFEIPLYRLED